MSEAGQKRGRAVATVLGAPLAQAYDVVLAHEHLAIDIRCWYDGEHAATRHLRDVVVGPETAAAVRRNPFACLDNLVLDAAAEVEDDLRALSAAGRALVVDVTPANVGRDVAGLRRFAHATGVDVVYGCGPYIAESRPDDDPDRPANSYRDEILAEFAADPAPAVIGEIGTGDPIQPVEAAALRGAAMAQAGLGAALYVHLHPWARRGHEALDLVAAAGGDLTRTVLCHLDPQIRGGLDYHRSLMDRGATIAFDLWGDEDQYGDVAMPTDAERIDATVQLVADGYAERLVHSHDVCLKTQLRAFGGAGFDHLPRRVAPRLAAAGLGGAEVRRQLAGNALALLSPTRERA
jgi:phosphotriesterase-related protein